MESKKKNNNFLLVILVILVFCLGGFILYDKVLSNNEKCNNKEELINNSDNQDELIDSEENYIKQKMLKTKTNLYNEMSMQTYFEYYMRYIPWQKKSLDDIKKLESETISVIVWRYIWENAENVDDRKMTVSEVNDFLFEYFNLSNYELKELVIDDMPTEGKKINIFGLTKEDGYYKATVVPTEYYLPEYKVYAINYDDNNIEIDFGVVDTELGSGFSITKNGTLTLKYNNGNFNFEKIEYENF